MQTTKFLVVIGMVAALAQPSHIFAGPDSEAQAKMREALRQKMEQLEPAPAPTTSESPVISEPIAPAKPMPRISRS